MLCLKLLKMGHPWPLFRLFLFFQTNIKKISTNEYEINRGSAIAQWIRLCLPSCRPEFESQAHYLCFHRFIELCNVEKTKMKTKKRLGLAYLKNMK